jgi:hypothetical protein
MKTPKYKRSFALLIHLKAEFGINMTESIRNGVALFFIAKQEEKKGRRLVFIDVNKNIITEIDLQDNNE